MAIEFTEYQAPNPKYGDAPDVTPGPEIATQSVAAAGASAQSAAFAATTELIVITKVDADSRIAIGANPVAVTTGVGQTRFVKAGSEYAFQVQPGHKLAAIAA